MRYKHVFLLWLWADLILAIGALFVVLATNMSYGVKGSDFGMFLLVLGYGLVLSLPSLITMLIFHYFYNQSSVLKKNYFKVYILVIASVNILYALCSYFIFSMQGEFWFLYIFTTIAGIISLYFIRLKINTEERREMIV